jgi:molecular chaperone GrpE
MNKHKKDKDQEEQKNRTEPEESNLENSEQEEIKAENNLDQSDSKIADLENQVKDLQDKLLRKAAEFENYKRRTENDQFNLINYAAESFIIKLLPIVDDFQRSMDHIDDLEKSKSVKDGIKLVYDKLQKLLNEQGVKKMETKGEPFNVEFHDALMQKKDDSVPPHTVVEEIEPGYLYREKVIRHAKVIVSEDSENDDNKISNDESNNSNTENEK